MPGWRQWQESSANPKPRAVLPASPPRSVTDATLLQRRRVRAPSHRASPSTTTGLFSKHQILSPVSE